MQQRERGSRRSCLCGKLNPKCSEAAWLLTLDQAQLRAKSFCTRCFHSEVLQ